MTSPSMQKATDLRQQRNAANRLLMEQAEHLHEAVHLLRDYVRIYPNNSGRAIRFLKELEEAGIITADRSTR